MVDGERVGCFPEGYPGNGEAGGHGLLVEKSGNGFGSWVCVDQIHRLLKVFEKRNEWVIAAQNHFVIDFFVDPLFHDPFDISEVGYHSALIERF